MTSPTTATGVNSIVDCDMTTNVGSRKRVKLLPLSHHSQQQQQHHQQQQHQQQCGTCTTPIRISSRERALITLNNTAIELLQRGREQSALKTFQDALQVQKSTADAALVRTALHTAAQCLVAVPAPAESTAAATQSAASWLVLSSQTDAAEAHRRLAEKRTSKALLRLDPRPTTTAPDHGRDNDNDNNNNHTVKKHGITNQDDEEEDDDDVRVFRSLLRSVIVYNFGIAHRCCNGPASEEPRVNSFCVQIFQYAESLLPRANNNNNNINNNINSNNFNLLFRLLLTRNLMMLSCRLGMALCEHYKETLDPIVDRILASSTSSDHGNTVTMAGQDEHHDKAPAA